MPLGESLVSPGSHCPGCGAPVKPYDNIPVVSWLLLRGRCRNCGMRISVRYPLVELATAIAFAAVVAVRGFDDDLILELPFVAALIALAAIDFDHKLLPNKIVYPLAAYGVIATLLVDQDDLVENLIAGAGAFLFLLVAVIAYPRGMGMGDVKLAGAMGLYLGLSVIPALLVAFLSGSLVGVVILAREGAAGAQEGGPIRRLPGAGRHRGRARGSRADRPLREQLPRLTGDFAQEASSIPGHFWTDVKAVQRTADTPCVRP